MNEDSPVPRCARCGAAVVSDAVEGLCPGCLMALNFVTETDIQGEEGGPARGKEARRPLPPVPTPEALAPHFPQFEILDCLGRGGMGAVYKARQPKLDRFVALKILLSWHQDGSTDAAFAQRFAREARALARLNHPAIVAVHDYGEAGGYPFLVMEYVEGVTLRQLLQSKKITPEEALAIVPKICEALQFAHQKGIVHRDIKPENILLDRSGQVKITDFGIAKVIHPGVKDHSLTGAKDMVGTPHYMAPEQVEEPAKVDHRADIFSLGVVFYEMLTGELPLGKFAPPSSRMRGIQVDVRLDEVVLRTLEKEPERRYQQASQVKTDVEAIATTAPASVGGDSPSSPKRPGQRQFVLQQHQQSHHPNEGLSMAGWMLMLGCAWILLAILVLLGRTVARTEPLMYAVFGLGGWLYPARYNAILCLPVVLGLTCLALGWVGIWGSSAALMGRLSRSMLGASPWLLVMITLLLGQKVVRTAPIMYAFYGVGGWMFPATAQMLIGACALLALVSAGMMWRWKSNDQHAEQVNSGFEERWARNRRSMTKWAMIGTTGLFAVGFSLFLWIQRPERLDTMVASQSPDGQFQALASTWRAVRVFGGDRLSYRFTVRGRGGTYLERWEAPVPIAELTDGYLVQPLGYYSFAQHGRIQWSEDSGRVLFLVHGIEVSALNLQDGSHSTQTGL